MLMKIHTLVNFEEMLEIPVGDEQVSITYDLYAVNYQLGGIDSGHYVSSVKIDQEWVFFDDTIIQAITSFDEVVKSNAYCLFYRRRRES